MVHLYTFLLSQIPMYSFVPVLKMHVKSQRTQLYRKTSRWLYQNTSRWLLDIDNKGVYLTLCIHSINPFPNKPWFLRVCSTSLLKTLWENEKLLVTSNFSFSHSVFYPFRELSANFIKLKIVVCKHL